jgi:MoaA/NifB/PqqE/SkfB family radical SAM enzyme
MINIFVTYRCNLSCSYCFARELRDEHPSDIQEASFRRLLRWMQGGGTPAAAFLGGEPTLHERLAEMIDTTAAAGITVVLFTNGLFPPDLAARLNQSVSNFVVNFSDPSTYTTEHKNLLHANLSCLAELGARITFSRNFTSDCPDYDTLLDSAARYGVRSVRYDISRPSSNAANDYVSMEETRRIMAHIAAFARECETRGIRTGLDCCLRLCDLPAGDRDFLERTSMKFRGICHPSIDIHPDLSASYCLPMRDVQVPDVTRFANSERLMHHFAAAVRFVRYENVPSECRVCADFRRFCQGGCMALKRLSPVPAFHAARQAASGAGNERY